MSIPLFLVGFSFVFSLMLIGLTTNSFAIYFGILAFVLFFIFLPIKKVRKDKTVLLVLASVVIACALFCLKFWFDYQPTIEKSGTVVSVEGKVIGFEKKSTSGANRYIIKVKDGELKGKKIRLSSKYASLNLNDYVSFKGEIYTLGTDESKNYYMAKGVFVGSYTYGDVDTLEVEKDAFDWIREKTYNIRLYVESELKRNLLNDYALTLLGMLIGEKSNLPDEIYENFQITGIVHLLAVSGFHVSLWSMIVYRSLLKRGLGIRLSSLFSILFVLLFMVLTGLSKSTVRAGIMMIVFFFGRLVLKQPDSKNSLGLSAIIIVLQNPFVCGDSGFLLSFFSTLGILVLFPSMQKVSRTILKRYVHNFYVRKRLDGVISVVLVTLSTLCFTLPIIMLFIGDLSLISPLTNLLVTSIASFSILLSGVGILLSKVPIICAFEKPLILVSGLIIKYMLWISKSLSRLPFAMTTIDENFFMVAVAAVLFLIGFALILKASKRTTVLLSTLLLTFSIIAHYLVEYVELHNYL